MVCMVLVGPVVMGTGCYLLNSGKSLNTFLFITYLRMLEQDVVALNLSGALLRDYQHQVFPSALLLIVTNGVEVLVGAVVMRTAMVCHLLNICESLVIFLLLVSLKTLEQLISEC